MKNNERAATKPGMPNGAARMHAFASDLRANTVVRNGQERIELLGYASMTERAYIMWDFFGDYREVVAGDAFDETLAANPDVAFLVNHRGVTMARTTNGTLELSADPLGLRSAAFLNPERQDVRDLVTAIQDGDITEMSFAFMIEDGSWNDDYDEFRINKVNLDRGDVSAVNYGANPYTSIAARSGQIMDEVGKLPMGAQRAAFKKLEEALRQAETEDKPETREDATEKSGQRAYTDPEVKETRSLDEVEKKVSEPVGREVRFWEQMLSLD